MQAKNYDRTNLKLETTENNPYQIYAISEVIKQQKGDPSMQCIIEAIEARRNNIFCRKNFFFQKIVKVAMA